MNDSLRVRRTQFLIVCAVVWLDAAGAGLLQPMLPYFVQYMGGRTAMVTQLVALYFLSAFLAAPVLGRLSDLYGRRRILLLTLAGAAASYLGMALSPSLWWVFGFRAIGGASSANDSLAQTMVTDDQAPATHLSRLATLGTVRSVGTVAGPVVGGLVALVILSPARYYQACLAVAILASAAVLVLVNLAIPKDRARPSSASEANVSRGTAAGPMLQTLRPILPLLAAVTGASYAVGVASSVTALYVQRTFNWTPAGVGWILAVFVTGSILSRTALLHKSVQAIEPKILLNAAIVFCSLVFLLIPVVNNPYAYLVLYFCFSLGSVPIYVIVSTRVAASTPNARGFALGAVQGIASLAMVVSASASGPLFEFVSPAAPYRFGALALALGLIGLNAPALLDELGRWVDASRSSPPHTPDVQQRPRSTPRQAAPGGSDSNA